MRLQEEFLEYLYDVLEHESPVELELSLPERKLWTAVLGAGIAGCVSGDKFDVAWIRKHSPRIGSFDWICDEALDIKCKVRLRKICLANAGKFINHSEFLKERYADSIRGRRKNYPLRTKFKKTFRRSD